MRSADVYGTRLSKVNRGRQLWLSPAEPSASRRSAPATTLLFRRLACRFMYAFSVDLWPHILGSFLCAEQCYTDPIRTTIRTTIINQGGPPWLNYRNLFYQNPDSAKRGRLPMAAPYITWDTGRVSPQVSFFGEAIAVGFRIEL